MQKQTISELFVYQCHLLKTLANSLDQDQRLFSGSKLFDIRMVFLNDFFQKINFEKNYPVCN